MFRVLLLLLQPFCGTPSRFPFFEKRAGSRREEQASDGLEGGHQTGLQKAPQVTKSITVRGHYVADMLHNLHISQLA